MKFPKIDLSSLPDLDTLTSVFGSLRGPGSDDSIIVLAAIVYESAPPGGGGLI